MRCITVLKSGSFYGLEYLERLAEGIKEHSGHELWCLSDIDVPNRIPLQHDWPGWWSKMELFRPDIEGRLFYLDLDTVICGDIRHMLEVAELTVLRHRYRWAEDRRVGSGLMMLPESCRPMMWNAWIRNSDTHNKRGDQDFMENVWTSHQKWQDLFPGQVLSVKEDCKRRTPEDARIVYYHGTPKPHENGWRAHV